jgi:hypothetical protein
MTKPPLPLRGSQLWEQLTPTLTNPSGRSTESRASLLSKLSSQAKRLLLTIKVPGRQSQLQTGFCSRYASLSCTCVRCSLYRQYLERSMWWCFFTSWGLALPLSLVSVRFALILLSFKGDRVVKPSQGGDSLPMLEILVTQKVVQVVIR